MPIRRGRKASITLTLSYFMFHWIASCCETGTTSNLLECSTAIRIKQLEWIMHATANESWILASLWAWQGLKPEMLARLKTCRQVKCISIKCTVYSSLVWVSPFHTVSCRRSSIAPHCWCHTQSCTWSLWTRCSASGSRYPATPHCSMSPIIHNQPI